MTQPDFTEKKIAQPRFFRKIPRLGVSKPSAYAQPNINKRDYKENEMAIFSILGFLSIGFGLIDFAGSFFGYDLTGVSWSPIVAGAVGSVLMNIGGGGESEDSEE